MSALHPKYEKALDDIFEAATWKQQGAHVQSVLVPVETFEHANAGLGLMRLELLHLAALRTRLEVLTDAVRRNTDRWCSTDQEYAAELDRIHAEYVRLRDAEVARGREALKRGGA